MINWSDLLTNMAHNATLIAYICHLSVIDGFTDTRNTCHRPLCVILVLQKNVSFWEDLFSVLMAYESTFTGAINLWPPVIQHIFQQSACTTLSWYSTCPETMMTSSTPIQLQQACNAANTKTTCDILWRTSCDIGILILRKVMEKLCCFLHVLFFPGSPWPWAVVSWSPQLGLEAPRRMDFRFQGNISIWQYDRLEIYWNIKVVCGCICLFYMWMSYIYNIIYVYCIE